MTRDLAFGTKILVAPTVREPDGLAMSSRNAHLSPEQRRQAAVLYRSLRLAQALVRRGERDPRKVSAAMRRMIEGERGAKVQYVEIVDPDGLAPVKRIKGRVIVAVAVYFGRTRLIDNIVLRV
jgi:pantoate--beta-alanine ligase